MVPKNKNIYEKGPLYSLSHKDIMAYSKTVVAYYT